jgi:CBS domain containing-hemolysin-like protein
MPNLDQGKNFLWQNLIRPAFFVPENKKIDDLLKEFQEKKIHMAVVVDEYGGSSGVVSLEDIIEEIVGDISDEFDDEDVFYSKLDDKNYVFQGKILMNDFYRVLEIEGEEFEEEKGDSDTLAGFILEIHGKIPKRNEKIYFKNYLFVIEAADSRKITSLKLTILEEENNDKKFEE